MGICFNLSGDSQLLYVQLKVIPILNLGHANALWEISKWQLSALLT